MKIIALAANVLLFICMLGFIHDNGMPYGTEKIPIVLGLIVPVISAIAVLMKIKIATPGLLAAFVKRVTLQEELKIQDLNRLKESPTRL